MSSIDIHRAEMSDEMQREALKCALLAEQMYERKSGMASYIKGEFDRQYQPSWHCIVGKSFSSKVSHTSNYFIHFSIDDKSFLLYKTG